MSPKILLPYSAKTGSIGLAFINFLFGVFAIIGGGVTLSYHKIDKHDISESYEEQMYYVLAIVLGCYNLLCGTVMIIALLKGEERFVFMYMIMELVNLMILSIFCGINMFFKESLILIIAFLVTMLLWYQLYNTYAFYKELAEYNSVKSGVIEIAYNGNTNPLMTLPEKAIDSTSV